MLYISPKREVALFWFKIKIISDDLHKMVLRFRCMAFSMRSKLALVIEVILGTLLILLQKMSWSAL